MVIIHLFVDGILNALIHCYVNLNWGDYRMKSCEGISTYRIVQWFESQMLFRSRSVFSLIDIRRQASILSELLVDISKKLL
jgi:hypothetical protein